MGARRRGVEEDADGRADGTGHLGWAVSKMVGARRPRPSGHEVVADARSATGERVSSG